MSPDSRTVPKPVKSTDLLIVVLHIAEEVKQIEVQTFFSTRVNQSNTRSFGTCFSWILDKKKEDLKEEVVGDKNKRFNQIKQVALVLGFSKHELCG